jgi:SAM-dependent methyltransferase
LSIPRERAAALVLAANRLNWGSSHIHEASPAPRGFSRELAKASGYQPSGYFPDGNQHHGFDHVDLEDQPFPAHSFDVVVALDVLEHVFEPSRAISEILRTLRPDGLAILTFPISPFLKDAMRTRAVKTGSGIQHIMEPEYHGSPFAGMQSLVTKDFGYGVKSLISEWGRCDVEMISFSDFTHGVIGDYTEVIVCRPRLSEKIAYSLDDGER